MLLAFDRFLKDHTAVSDRIGWHTFRHSYPTLLKANGEDVKVVQESLRHTSSKITLDVYTHAVTPAKRAAQRKVGGDDSSKCCFAGCAGTVSFLCVPTGTAGRIGSD